MRHTKFLLCLILILALLMPAEPLQADVMTPYGKYRNRCVAHRKALRRTTQPAARRRCRHNPMTRYIKDKVNVEIQVDWEVEGSEFANKLSLMLVSGSLPDMFTLGAGDYLLFRQLMENDMLEDLSSAYEACANDHIKNTIGPNGSTMAVTSILSTARMESSMPLQADAMVTSTTNSGCARTGCRLPGCPPPKPSTTWRISCAHGRKTHR